MKIFVGYGYNERDKWIPELVVPLLEAMGVEVVDGQELAGMSLSAEVTDRIKRCDAVLGFCTRRGTGGVAPYPTHQWVLGELAAGVTAGIPAAMVRETDVDEQAGILSGLGYLTFAPDGIAGLLVRIAKQVALWGSRRTYNLSLMPADIARGLARLHNQGVLRCIYRVMESEDEVEASTPVAVQLQKTSHGSFFVVTEPLEANALIQLEIREGETKSLWKSGWQNVRARLLHLERTRT